MGAGETKSFGKTVGQKMIALNIINIHLLMISLQSRETGRKRGSGKKNSSLLNLRLPSLETIDLGMRANGQKVGP